MEKLSIYSEYYFDNTVQWGEKCIDLKLQVNIVLDPIHSQ